MRGAFLAKMGKPVQVSMNVIDFQREREGERERERERERVLCRPVLKGAAKLIGVDGKLETKIVATGRVRENLYHRILTKHIAPL